MLENQIPNVTETEIKCRLFCTSGSLVSKKFVDLESGTTLSENSPISFNSVCEAWKTHPIEVFQQRLSSNIEEAKKAPKSVIEFYKQQDEHIRELEKIATIMNTDTTDVSMTFNPQSTRRQTRINTIIISIVFFANVVLLLGKAVASALSGSLAIISSLLDSCVDLASGGIMWFAARQMRKRKPYKYPQGRRRLEPLAVIVLSVFMASISLQLLAESVQAIVRMSQNNQEPPIVNNLALGIMASVIVMKLFLWIICIKFGGGMAVDALKTDQRNDIITNAASILFSGLAGRLPPVLGQKQYEDLKYLDPIGAILIGSYILYSWYKLGAEQIRNLAGHTADPRFIQKIAFVCLNYHPLIQQLDTIRAFHFGEHFLVEVDIVLPKEMYLKEAHDIGEGLQKKLEKLESVERAFVHLDYEFSHRPDSEHKVV
ncbi:Metal tolerance protein 5 [Schistosoma japonicum]|nr:Metal tolerance protein 5 [Schistosoma japonicum]